MNLSEIDTTIAEAINLLHKATQEIRLLVPAGALREDGMLNAHSATGGAATNARVALGIFREAVWAMQKGNKDEDEE